MSSDATIDGDCPTCGMVVAAPIIAACKAPPPEALLRRLPRGEEGITSLEYELATCPRCSEPFVRQSALAEPSGRVHQRTILPVKRDADDRSASIPIYCSACNCQVQAESVAGHHEREYRGGSPFDDDANYSGIDHHITKCPTCEEIAFVKCTYDIIAGELQANDSITVLFPAPRRASISEAPATASRAYMDATRCYQAGLYEPCVIMCRKCVEAICHELGARNGKLYPRLKKLRDDGLIDQKLYDWANELRLLGNDAAHELDVEVQQDDATDALGFIEALIAYTFELNTRFDAFKARRATRKSRPLQ